MNCIFTQPFIAALAFYIEGTPKLIVQTTSVSGVVTSGLTNPDYRRMCALYTSGKLVLRRQVKCEGRRGLRWRPLRDMAKE